MARVTKSALVSALALACATACSTDRTAEIAGDEKVLNVYNWADYIAPDTLEKFEAEYGIKVNYDVYDSSEVLDVKLLAGNSGYDVVVHSNQFTSRLVPIGIFQKLDYSRLDNVRNLDPAIMERIDVYPKTRGYTIPYHWGSTGYAWNEALVRERLPGHPMDSADVLFDPAVVSKLADCGVSLLDGPTDLFPMVLAYLGRDPNAVDDENLAAAEAQLKLVRPYIRYFSNQKMMTDLPTREVCVAMSWSGDYSVAWRRAREAGIDLNLAYTVPKEGVPIWLDAAYIPADAPHPDNAHKFIDFLLRPDVIAPISNFTGYANANREATALVDPGYTSNPAIYPDEEILRRLHPTTVKAPKIERRRSRTFTRVKTGL